MTRQQKAQKALDAKDPKLARQVLAQDSTAIAMDKIASLALQTNNAALAHRVADAVTVIKMIENLIG